MRNDTLNALILRHGDRMLKDAGWPPCVDMMQIAPETMPGWSVATGSLDAAHILALVTHLCQPLTYGRAGLLTASARRLAGTPARLYLYPAKGFMPPEKLADAQTLHLPYAQEWLTAAECDDLLAFLKASLTQTPEQKAACGVVVSLSDGELRIQRGVQKKVQAAVADGQESTGTQASLHVVSRSTPDAAEGISLPLLKKMSSERTLAVQAELVRQPQKAVALMVWRLCSCVFHYCITTRHPFVMNLGVHHSSLTSEAPTGENGQAWQSLMQEKARLEALLPEGWKNDFTTFFALDGQTLMSLMAFCTACSVDGVQTREHGHTRRSDLDGVEAALGFHLRDWWQPTADNFLGLLSKNQIVAALNDAGLTGAASDAEKMKKGDAASHAEQWLSGTRWVPGWMQSPDAATPEEAASTPDTDEPTSHAA